MRGADHWWSRLLAPLAERVVLRRTLGNSLWLLADQAFRLIVAVFVGLWVARHLGPERFGLLNVATSYCAPFAAFLLTGLNAIVVRDLVREPSAEASIMGTSAILKLVGGALALVLGGCIAWWSPIVDDRTWPLVLVVLAGSIFSAGEVSDLWMQARGEARRSAWVRSVAALASSVIKVGLIIGDAALLWFAAVGALELALCATGWMVTYRRGGGSFATWNWDRAWARRLLMQGWPLLLGGMAIQVQAYYDQVLLAGMREPGEVGIYAAALRIVALLGFLPMAVYTAAAPEVTRAHQADRELYARRLRDVYRVMLLAFALMALPMVLVPDVLIRWTVGDDYVASAALLPWLSLRLLLTNLGVARGLHLTNEGLFIHGLLTAVAGMVVNLSLNAFLIPIYGAHGCVASALISFTVNVLLLEWLDKRARFSLNVLGAAVGLCRLPK